MMLFFFLHLRKKGASLFLKCSFGCGEYGVRFLSTRVFFTGYLVGCGISLEWAQDGTNQCFKKEKGNRK